MSGGNSVRKAGPYIEFSGQEGLTGDHTYLKEGTEGAMPTLDRGSQTVGVADAKALGWEHGRSVPGRSGREDGRIKSC